MKPKLAAVGCAVLLAALTACGGSDETASGGSDTAAPASDAGGPLAQVCQEAASEGELTWYNSFVPANEAQIVAGFNDAHPDITVRSLRLTGAEAGQRFAAEADAGATTADVLSQSQQDFAADALAKGWVIELSEEEVPGLDALDDQYVRGGEVVSAIAPIRLTINTELVDEAPDSWEDILADEYKGQLIVADPRSILPWMTLFDLLREEYGIEYLEKLGQQDFRLVESAVPGSQSLAAGEAKALLPSLDSVSNPLIKQGAPVESIPLSPTTGVENSTLINADADHPNAARCFVGWLISEDGQEAVNGNGFGASPLGDAIDSALELPPGYQSPDGASAREHTDEIVKALDL